MKMVKKTKLIISITKNVRKKQLVLYILVVLFCSSGVIHAGLITGQINSLQGTIDTFYWGDGINDLHQGWSVNNSSYSGWFYGSAYSTSNVDVYIYHDFSEPTLITDASAFSYHDSYSQTYPSPYGPSWAGWAHEGDTVFFKGTNGFYGAWYIEDIYYDPTNSVDYAALNGTWYFLDDGTANFSVPEPATLIILAIGGLTLKRKNRN